MPDAGAAVLLWGAAGAGAAPAEGVAGAPVCAKIVEAPQPLLFICVIDICFLPPIERGGPEPDLRHKCCLCLGFRFLGRRGEHRPTLYQPGPILVLDGRPEVHHESLVVP